MKWTSAEICFLVFDHDDRCSLIKMDKDRVTTKEIHTKTSTCLTRERQRSERKAISNQSYRIDICRSKNEVSPGRDRVVHVEKVQNKATVVSEWPHL